MPPVAWYRTAIRLRCMARTGRARRRVTVYVVFLGRGQ